jgi:hypothetical protein
MSYAEVLMCSEAAVSWTLVLVCGLTDSAISRKCRSSIARSGGGECGPAATDLDPAVAIGRLP